MSQNQLAQSTSPYLLQHADNPVHWYEWGDEALGLAREQNKPILLSIGYSACHWCHVMAHESFESEETAWLMNELFINIKVDREERPDLDKLYQTAHSLITQRNGGWPLTMFLNPQDQMPFFGGTYFPDQPRHGLPAFRDLVQRVSDYYHQHTDDIARHNQEMASTFRRIYSNASPEESLDPTVLDAVRTELSGSFDHKHGGFGAAPKFPQVSSLERLMRHWAATSLYGEADEQALQMAVHSLRRMSEGGLFDQLGGGYCRYSVDELWMIPHFEKMLYDNGPLLCLVSDLFVATGDETFRRAAQKTANWTMREMQSEAGGYYSALDADSEGEEGKFYCWTPDEVRALLEEPDYSIFAARYGLDQGPNFEGKWHLHTYKTLDEIAALHGLGEEAVRCSLETSEHALFEVRSRRIHPGLDDKQLTSWNALMIRGMFRAATALENPDYADSALRALDFIHNKLWDGERLLAAAKGEKAHLNAYLDDYAYLLDALLESLQWQWRSDHLEWAISLSDALLRHFASEKGGFYFTSDDHEQLIERPRGFADEAMPSGNAIATRALLRLGYLLAEPRYLDAAEQALRAGMYSMKQNAMAHSSLINALEEQLYPPMTLILRGSGDSLDRIRSRINGMYAPRLFAYYISSDQADLPDALVEKKPVGEITAYACEGVQCRAPISDEDEIMNLIDDFAVQSE